MATQDEMARARILALRAPSQMQASPFVPTGGRPNPLTQMASGPRPMVANSYIPSGVPGRNPLAGTMTGGSGRPDPLTGVLSGRGLQPLPFPNQKVVRPTFPKPPVYAPLPVYRGPEPTAGLPPWDQYYGSPKDIPSETPWKETWLNRLRQPV